jgi:hypothetical protein
VDKLIGVNLELDIYRNGLMQTPTAAEFFLPKYQHHNWMLSRGILAGTHTEPPCFSPR